MADPSPSNPISESNTPIPDARAQLDALRRGDERVFVELVKQYNGMMVRIAQMYVGDHITAGEVVQEAWLGVLRGLNGFEGRSSLKTWIFTIVSNLAKTRGMRDKRTIPFSFIPNYEEDTDEPAVPAERFRGAGEIGAFGWKAPPAAWESDPVAQTLNGELKTYLDAAVEALPDQQRAVITLRDIQGWTADEVCNALGIAETNQRVLLHRARSKVRRALEQYMLK